MVLQTCRPLLVYMKYILKTLESAWSRNRTILQLLQGVPKKWDLLLLFQVVNPTFLGGLLITVTEIITPWTPATGPSCQPVSVSDEKMSFISQIISR